MATAWSGRARPLPLKSFARPRVKRSQRYTQTAPSAPVRTKGERQPHFETRTVTTIGARIAPSALPLLKMPFASGRSGGGSRRSVVFSAHGQLNASPAPSNRRHADMAPSVGANVVSMLAADQTPTAAGKTVRGPRAATVH